jgi:uncharacterized protein (DUF2062 family)
MSTESPAGASTPQPRKQWPWYRPVLRNWRRYYLRQFPRKKKLHGGWLHRLLGNRLFDPGLWLPTRESVAFGVAIGTFVGLMPFLGLQIVLSLLLCFAFRVNVTAAVLATFISNPVTGAPILYLQREVGLMLSAPLAPVDLEGYSGIAKGWMEYGRPLMLGALVTGAAAALLSYPITWILWTGISNMGKKAIAVRQAHRHHHDAKDAHSPQEARTVKTSDASADAAENAPESRSGGSVPEGASGDPFVSGAAADPKKD